MRVDQASILHSFIQGQDGQIWANGKTGWNKGDLSVCFWDGVLCDPSDQSTVTGIFLPGGSYSGTLPSELGLLTTLRELSMPQNKIRGRIPDQVAYLPHLEVINLAENEITGTLPAFRSAALYSVDLSHNLLAGPLDPDIGLTHKALTDFDVVHNKLTGVIPESFANLELLDTLSLSENRFSGTLPESLGKAKQMRYLYLDNNFFMGTIPPEIARRDSPLEELWLQQNLLSGTIPAALADLKALFNFYIDGNKFTGTVPDQLCRQEINEDFFDKSNLVENRDYCDSIACRPGYVSYEGVFPCSPCNDTYYNPYLGRIGSCIDMIEEDILDNIYDSARGEDWVGGVNWNTPNIPKCAKTGITCDDNDNIIAINLKNKGLRGSIPESIGFLQFLERLDLSENLLTGFVPSDLRWAPLETLDITGNELRGIIPLKLCEKDGINGIGKKGQFGCDMIACSAGFKSELGYASADDKCVPCKNGKTSFVGSKVCFGSNNDNFNAHIGSSKPHEGLSKTGGFFVFVFFLTVVVGSVFAVIKVHGRLSTKRILVSQSEEDADDSEFGELSGRMT